MQKTSTVKFESYNKSVAEALNNIDAGNTIKQQKKIIIKPNLINNSPHPITTPKECVAALIDYIRDINGSAEIIVAEGCGDPTLETEDVFRDLGYTKLAEEKNIKLIDLNHAKQKKLTNPSMKIFKEIYLPQILFEGFLISVPVLKVHSLAEITGALKNMIGAASPKYYGGRYGNWKKAFFHKDMQRTIIELNMYRKPDLSLMDATIGMAEFHLGGPHCNPPVNKIIAGFSAVEVDRIAAGLLNLNWKNIGHLLPDYE